MDTVFRDVAERFNRHNAKLVKGRQLAASTADKYTRTANIICRYLGDTPVAEINRVVGQEYAADRVGDGIAASTVNYELQVLRAILSFASELGHIKEPPTIKRMRNPKPEPDLPDMGKVRAYLDRLPDQHREPLLFSMITGVSWYEVERLEWQDVNFKRGTIGIGQRPDFGVKTEHRARVLSMSKPVRQLLKDAGPSAPTERVFPYAKSTRRYLDRDNAGFTPNLMRKAFASAAADMALPENHLQRLLGHAPGSVVTRKHYVRSNRSALDAGAAKIAEALS